MKNRGSVAILCLLTAGLLITAFLMIYDYGIYALARQQIESGLQASLSSVLAGYDPDVMRELGLFALHQSPEQTGLGKDYLQCNLNSRCAPLQMRVEAYNLTYDAAGSLSQRQILNQQILELETYEGWLGFGSELLDFLEINPLPSGLGAAEFAMEPAKDSVADGLSLWQLLAPWPIQGWTCHWLRKSPDAEPQENPAGPADEHSLGEVSSWLAGALGEDQVLNQFAADIKKRLKAGLFEGRERILRSSYILDQLDYMTAKTVRQRYFSRCETEYILWGDACDWSNVRQTAFRMLLFRMILQSAYQFGHNAPADPSLRLGAALVEGFSRGRADVEALFRGEKIPAFPGQTRLKMSYRDHLRLFLLMQSEDEQLDRLQDLLEANIRYWGHKAFPESLVLSDFYTKIRASAAVRISLWPLGSFLLTKQGEMGYDVPFSLVQ